MQRRLLRILPLPLVLALSLFSTGCRQEVERRSDEQEQEQPESEDPTNGEAAENSSDRAESNQVGELNPINRFGASEEPVAVSNGDIVESVVVTTSEALEIALAEAKPGTEIVLDGGTFAPFEVNSKSGLTIRGVNGAKVLDGQFDRTASIKINSSTGVVVDGLELTNSLWGVFITDSTQVAVVNSHVHSVGQEAIHIVGRSSHVTIANNRIHDTGNRPGTTDDGVPFSDYGELVYVGDGSSATEASASESPDQIRIFNNDMSDSTAEAIDIKAPVGTVYIGHNYIHDIRTATSGAVVVGIDAPERGSGWGSAVTLDSNLIVDVSTSGEFNDGNAIIVAAGATIVNNVITGADHRNIFVAGELPPGDEVVIRGNEMTPPRLGSYEGDDTSVVDGSSGSQVSTSGNQTLGPAELAARLQSAGRLTPKAAAAIGASTGTDEESFGEAPGVGFVTMPLDSDGKPMEAIGLRSGLKAPARSHRV